jgi:hypothetical protein
MAPSWARLALALLGVGAAAAKNCTAHNLGCKPSCSPSKDALGNDATLQQRLCRMCKCSRCAQCAAPSAPRDFGLVLQHPAQTTTRKAVKHTARTVNTAVGKSRSALLDSLRTSHRRSHDGKRAEAQKAPKRPRRKWRPRSTTNATSAPPNRTVARTPRKPPSRKAQLRRQAILTRRAGVVPSKGAPPHGAPAKLAASSRLGEALGHGLLAASLSVLALFTLCFAHRTCTARPPEPRRSIGSPRLSASSPCASPMGSPALGHSPGSPLSGPPSAERRAARPSLG